MGVEFTADFEAIRATVRENTAMKLQEAAEATAEEAKRNVPYDENKRPTPENPDGTHLRDTIAATEVVETDSIITVAITAGDEEAGVVYAEYVELGLLSNPNYPAQPYLGPAYEVGRAHLTDGLGEIVPDQGLL